VKVAANDFQISMTISKNGYFPERLAAEVTLSAITRLTFFVTFSSHRLTLTLAAPRSVFAQSSCFNKNW
jgi:hypothetical protein